MWGAAIAAVGSLISGIFGFKKSQGDAIQAAVKVVSEVNSSNSQREQAIATIIAAENSNGYWLAAVWRPMLMVFFAILIGSFWFGYVPEHLDKPMSPMMEELFTILKIGIGGYIPARTLEKIVHNMNVGAVLKKFIEKKVL